jgi:ABC-type amino acid transport substrate-binding protein
VRRAFPLVIIAALLLAACGSSGDDGASSTESVADRVASTGTVRIGVRNDNPPMSFIDDNGDWVEFDLELAQLMADELGSEIVEFDDKLAAVQALRDGAVEGYTEDNITLLSLAAGDPELTLLPGGHNRVQFGIGVPENDSKWRDNVNLALQDLWTSGEFDVIYDKWFVDPDSRIIDLPLGGSMEIWG